jgi:hypothetical protein
MPVSIDGIFFNGLFSSRSWMFLIAAARLLLALLVPSSLVRLRSAAAVRRDCVFGVSATRCRSVSSLRVRPLPPLENPLPLPALRLRELPRPRSNDIPE